MAKRKPLLTRVRDKIRVDPITGCWNWPKGVSRAPDAQGGTPYISYQGKTTPVRAAIWKETHPAQADSLDNRVIPRCKNIDCVRPEHLMVGEASGRNTRPYSTWKVQRKLAETLIRQRHIEGMTVKEIADIHHLSPQLVSEVTLGRGKAHAEAYASVLKMYPEPRKRRPTAKLKPYLSDALKGKSEEWRKLYKESYEAYAPIMEAQEAHTLAMGDANFKTKQEAEKQALLKEEECKKRGEHLPYLYSEAWLKRFKCSNCHHDFPLKPLDDQFVYWCPYCGTKYSTVGHAYGAAVPADALDDDNERHVSREVYYDED